jgi:EcsC protein family
MEFSSEDLADLGYAKSLLEHPGLAARIAHAIGTPVEKLLDLLPENAAEIVRGVTNQALTASLNFAMSTMADRYQPAANWLHKTAVAITGAAGGAFGITTLAVELPASTIIMLRSIADIARSEGEDINSPEARLACLEVFALSGSQQADATESGYFAVRTALARALSEAAEYIAERGVAREGAPALVRFLSQVAARFGVPVSEKVMAQSVPVIGAAGGAMINLLFIDHFQDVARGHFIVRRLERQFGAEEVKRAYSALEGTPHGENTGPKGKR